VSGTVDIRAANRDGEGVELLAPPGAGVRAVEEGRVAWADRHGSFGLMVIVDHGDRYFTVYASLGSTDVRVGDHVSRGARLGVTSERPLFFQVREGARALDASGWLGL
jgi:septal ring factor EnvC (AmiA/AmiB activator)